MDGQKTAMLLLLILVVIILVKMTPLPLIVLGLSTLLLVRTPLRLAQYVTGNQ